MMNPDGKSPKAPFFATQPSGQTGEAAHDFLLRSECAKRVDARSMPPPPRRVVILGGKPYAVEPDPQQESIEWERYVDKVCLGIRKTMLDPVAIEGVGGTVDDFGDMVLLRVGAVTNIAREDLPHNHTEVQPAGVAVVKAIATEPEAATLQIDAPLLVHELDRVHTFEVLSQPFNRLAKVLDANRTQSLGRISKMVRDGLDRAISVVLSNASLMAVLEPALELVSGPAAEAVRTRRANQRLANQIEEKHKAAAAAKDKDEAESEETAASGQDKVPRKLPR